MLETNSDDMYYFYESFSVKTVLSDMNNLDKKIKQKPKMKSIENLFSSFNKNHLLCELIENSKNI